jgi:hypothetical protein
VDRESRRIQNSKESGIRTVEKSLSSKNMLDGEQLMSKPRGKPLAIHKKHKGTLWKVNLSKDGNQIVEKDLNIDGSLVINGNRKEKNQPSFLAFNSATDTSISTGGVYADVEFNSEVFDVGDNFASNTFTAPVTGKYFLHTSVSLSEIDIDVSYYAIKLVTSNRNYYSIFDPHLASDTSVGIPNHLFQITCVADMEAADTAKVQIIQSGGNAQTDVMGHATELYTWFNGYLLG